ncbi:MAG: class I SAM-dependent methyltransferase [Thermoplasmata archaeon]
MRTPRRPTPRPAPEPHESAAERFRDLDSYRARREWLRYEGTAQRDLFRELRERFLLRHSAGEGWVLDIGSGPGRFLPFVGRDESNRVALDLSREMLKRIPDVWVNSGRKGPVPSRVLGDALRPPLEPGHWAEVVALGNPLGFAGPEADRLLETMEDLVRPGGSLLLEVAPSSGERSRYLGRLPPSSLSRFLRAPVPAVLARLDREGFRPEPSRKVTEGSFRRFPPLELHERWRRSGWEVIESMAVAPALGADPRRSAAVRSDHQAWSHLLDLEEQVGRRRERWSGAAAVLLCARSPPSKRTVK